MRPRRNPRSIVRVTLVLAIAAGSVLTASVASARVPDRIPLPRGSQPEGMTIAGDGTFYTGSLATGTIYEGDVRTGDVRVLVPEGYSPRVAVGMQVHDGLLWVAGGPTSTARVYTRAGRLVRTYDLQPGAFVNDVAVTDRAAYFTDSLAPFVYRVPIGDDGTPAGQADVQVLPLRGDLTFEDGFNANGIDFDRRTGAFVVAQTNTGELFRMRPSGWTREIDLGGTVVRGADGVLLQGRTLFVVQNFQNKLATVALDPELSSGKVLRRLSDSDFDVPTSVDVYGETLYLVNARFTTPPTPDTRYWIAPVRTPRSGTNDRT